MRVVNMLLVMKKMASLLIALMSLYVFGSSPLCRELLRQSEMKLENGRMKNVTAAYATGASIYPPEAKAPLADMLLPWW